MYYFAEMTRGNIVVWLPQYGRSFNEKSWVTRPTQIARFIGGEELLNDTACVTVDGKLWDCNRVLVKSCTLCFVSSSTREGLIPSSETKTRRRLINIQ
jgi:hypothetical protein